MVRVTPKPAAFWPGSPHVRGDGPEPGARHQANVQFSPRAWGWSAPAGAITEAASVLPTCVGMVRYRDGGLARRGRSPHVRGDGPFLETGAGNELRFSPRAWGWSGPAGRETVGSPVLPTCVGMVRARCQY